MTTSRSFYLAMILVFSFGVLSQEAARQAALCNELVASVRPPASGEEEDARHRDEAERPHRDCRGSKMPADVRAKALFKYGIVTAFAASSGRHDCATGSDRSITRKR